MTTSLEVGVGALDMKQREHSVETRRGWVEER